MIRMSTTKETEPIPHSPKRLTRMIKLTGMVLENGLQSAAFAKALPLVSVVSRRMAGLLLPKNGLCSIERESQRALVAAAAGEDGWWGWREREKKSDGLERGKQILGEKNLSKKSDFGFGGKKAKWNTLGGKQIFGKFCVGKIKEDIYFEEKLKIKIKEDNFN